MRTAIKFAIINFLIIICSYSYSKANHFASPKDVSITTQVSGKFLNATPHSKATLSYIKNRITQETQEFDLTLGSDNHYHLRFPLSEPSIVQIEYNNNKISLFIQPGDDVKMNFDVHSSKPSFYGKGNQNNTFLFQFYEQFKTYTNEYILKEWGNFDALNFKINLDDLHQRKWDFYHDYNDLKKEELSRHFKDFLFADIEYQWAYLLLRYAYEREELNIEASEYFDFLQKIKINNDRALVNDSYIKFIDILSKITEASLYKGINEMCQEQYFEVHVPKTALKEDKDAASTDKVFCFKNEKLRYLNEQSEKTKMLIGDSNIIGFWYKVRSNDGVEGWIFSSNGRLFNTLVETKTKHQEVSSIQEVKKRVAVAKVDNLKIRNSPDDSKSDVAVSEKSVMDYLGYQSAKKYTFTIRGVEKNDFFYKIVTSTGKIGWVFGGGIELKDTLVVTTVKKLVPVTVEEPVDQKEGAILVGKAKYYQGALKIYDKILVENPFEIEKEVNNFLDNNPYPDINNSIRTVFNKSLREEIDKNGRDYFIPAPETEKPEEKIELLEEDSNVSFYNMSESNPSAGKLDPNLEAELDLMSQGYTPDEAKAIVAEKNRLKEDKEKTVQSEVKQSLSDSELLKTINLDPIEREHFSVSVNGKIIAYNQKDAKVIVYPDPVTMNEVVYNLYIKPDGSFTSKFSIYEPTIGKFVYGAREIEIYLEPSDNLTINFNATDFKNSIKFTGKGSKHNQFIQKLRKSFKNEDIEIKGKIYTASAEAFKKYMDKIYKTKINFYNNSEIGGFSDAFKKFIQADITYSYAYMLTNYRYENPLQYGNSKPIEIKNPNYYNYLEEIDIVQDNAFPNQNYVYFLDVYLDDRWVEAENKAYNKVELAEKYLEGKALYFYQAKTLSLEIRNGNLAKFLFDVKLFMDSCPHPEYKESVKEAIRESGTLLVGMDAPNFKLVDVLGREVTLDDFKDKVIYLDFWATWCNSCIYKMKNSNNFRKQFLGKDVVFVYISIDHTEREWKNYVSTNRLIHTHLYTSEGLNSEVCKNYGVKKIPSVFIIDKKGKIALSINDSKNHNTNMTETIFKLLEE